ncbi:MAG: DNA mismatch repair protein MutL [Lentimonas sp.]|jgi:DNA mismatch repair protein MutL
MSSIRILPDRVANQIAAGEVIERPVAVVKELIENSIDAGATRIEIEFRNGGKSYMRVEDNGKGMSPNEALLCLERHATSKIREAADLNEVQSFGFRGEALPSIASVSKFTLRTRTEDSPHGTEVQVNAGKIVEKKDCGMPVGTVIEVAHLFNSVPARRKFLKTEPTETAHITYNCRLFAVAHPSIAFRVLENGRTIFQSPTCKELKDRVAEIWGRSLANDLIPVDSFDPNTGFKLTGLTARPGVGRSTRRELVTLVNRRPVDSRTLSFAVLDAYQGRIQKGRFPPAFLFLHISQQEIDVNVHPTKREVRFRNEGSVRRFVLNAIMETLAAEQPQPLASNSEKALSPKVDTDRQVHTPDPKLVKSEIQQTDTNYTTDEISLIPDTTSEIASKTITNIAKTKTIRLDKATADPQPPTHYSQPESAPGWRLITLLKKRYALFETDRGLLVLHIRHADQRVRFERICKETRKTTPPGQNLLIPHPLELEPLASETLKSQLGQLNTQGFHIEEFGRNIYRIESVPVWLSPDQAEEFVRDYVDLVRLRSGARKQGDLGLESLARLAVKDSFRRNDLLNESAVQQLAKELLACDTPHTSPFGKPTFNEIDWNEWQRRFGGE